MQPVPLTVLTGFLGAGKTTLLNRILNGDHGLRVGVLVNDFGSINIDAELVVGVASDVVSLANGCVCCSIRGDLVDAVEQILARPERPEYLLLEASGVAEPSGIALTFVDDSRMRDLVRLDSIVCVLDADQVFATPELAERKIWQLAFADLVVLNKVDLVGATRIEEIKAWLDERMHRYRLVEARHCDVPLEVLLGVGRFDPAAPDLLAGLEAEQRETDHVGGEENGAHRHPRDFATWSFQSTRPLSVARLRRVASRLPASVYRVKGIVYSAETPERRAVLQVVGKRADITLEQEWGQDQPQTQIVAIGRNDADLESLRDAFEGCGQETS